MSKTIHFPRWSIVVLGSGFEDKQGIRDIDPLVFELVRAKFRGLQCGVGAGVCRMGGNGTSTGSARGRASPGRVGQALLVSSVQTRSTGSVQIGRSAFPGGAFGRLRVGTFDRLSAGREICDLGL